MTPDAKILVGADTTVAASKMEELGTTVRKGLDGIGKAYMGVLGVIAAGKGITSALSVFTAPAAELENVATSLGVVMGNAEAAERLTGSLRRLATNGVVSFDELHRSARALTNVFQDDAVISHYVSRLADIAAGADIPASRLAELVARMEDMGKAELTELANKGVPIFETLADVLGKSRDEVVQMSQEGKISCRALLAAFEKLTDAGGRYHRLNSELSNTTKGSWDTLMESIKECKEALGTPINDELRPVLQDLAAWVQENKASITAVGQGIVKVCTNVHTLTIALGVLAGTMRGQMAAGLSRMAASFKPVMVGMRDFRLAWALTGSFWGTTWTGMVVAARAACVAIKSAVISTGIGILVWGIGEAVAWCVEKFSDAEDAAKDMGEAAAEAALATKEALDASKREMEQREAAARAEREQTEQMQKQARLAQEAADAEKERLRIVAEMARARKENDFEREMDALRDMGEPLGGGAAGVIRARLRRVGVPSEEALYAERGRLERRAAAGGSGVPTSAGAYAVTGTSSGSMSEEQQRRYEQVAAAISKIEEEHRKAEEAARSHRAEMERLRDNYYDRKSTYNQNRAEAAYEKKSIGGQERQLRRDAQAAGYWGEMEPEAIRAHLDELARTDIKGNERQIAALERILQLHDELVERKQRYEQLRQGDMQELRIQALELAGRKAAADKLREELAMQKRIAELRERGATKKQAEEQATMEAKLQRVKEQRERVRGSRVEWVQGHLASVGGGGVSSRIGTSQLAEAKVHTKWLREIYQAVKKAQGQQGSNVAVLA